MPRDAPRSDTRDRILDIAERHMMQVGYQGFSFHDIADELAVKTPAIHYHFRTKADLAVAVIVRYGVKFEAWMASVAHRTPAERLDAYLEVGRYVVSLDRACALGMLNAQLRVVPDEVRVVALAVQERILDFYRSALEAARADGDVRFEGSAADKAAEVASALVGAQQLARGFGPEAYDRVARQIRLGLGRAA